MLCKICHQNETDNTSGICWECMWKFMNYFNSQKGNFFENGTKPLDEQELL